MRLETALAIILPAFIHILQNKLPEKSDSNPYQMIASIPLPAGFERTKENAGSFASWLRTLPLKKIKQSICITVSAKQTRKLSLR